MNKVLLTGRLSKDPEEKGNVVYCEICVKDPLSKRNFFIPIRVAGINKEYFLINGKKGMITEIEGNLHKDVVNERIYFYVFVERLYCYNTDSYDTYHKNSSDDDTGNLKVNEQKTDKEISQNSKYKVKVVDDDFDDPLF